MTTPQQISSENNDLGSTPLSTNRSSSSSSSSSMQQKKLLKKKFSRSKKKKTRAPPQEEVSRPRKSLIRKRPVSFGNPALGTYHGCLFTLDVIGEDYSPINRPIIEGAEAVERVVAMVDVPPEQVPEGILNLARSHRPYLHHVRIVIAENNEEFRMESEEPIDNNSEEDEGSLVGGGGQEETKDELPSTTTHDNSNGNFGIRSESPSLAATAVQNAASILAKEKTEEEEVSSDLLNGAIEKDKERHKEFQGTPSENEDDAFSVPSRTYLVLLELCSVDAAEEFVEDLHGKPYTSLDPTQTCSVHQVLAMTGEDGVSLLSPFFAPSAKTKSSKTTTGANTASAAVAVATTTTTHVHSTPAPAAPPAIVEDYNCAVCLEHMILSDTDHESTDSRSSVLTTVCNHTFHLDCFLQLQDHPCPVCRYDHSGLNEALSQCNVCGTTENNYVCLICGMVSCGGPPIRGRNSVAATGVAGVNSNRSSHSPVCGASALPPPTRSDGNDNNNNNNNTLPAMETSRQLSQSHARKHYDETLHAYALDTETQHVWDFAGQGYVHRLLQNKEDGKLVEVHDPSNTSSHERSLNPGLSDTQEGEVLHRKLEGFASQYYTLLKSQLEQQRIYYEGRLEELRRESFLRKKAQTSDLINALKQEKAQLSKRVVSLKARHRKVVEDVSFLKEMNSSLEANKEPLKRRVREAQQQRLEAKDQLEQCLPVLEEKVTMLMLQLTGEATSGNSETGTDGATVAQAASREEECAPPRNPKTLHRSSSSQSDDRKPAAKR